MKRQVSVAIIIGIFLYLGGTVRAQQPPSPEAFSRRNVLQTTTTLTGQPLQFPLFRNMVTGVLSELAPGGQTGPQRFPGPTVLYVLDGTLTLEFEGSPPRPIVAGQGAAPPYNLAVNRRNASTLPVRWVAVTFSDASKSDVTSPATPPVGLRSTVLARTTKTWTGEDIVFPLLANQLSVTVSEGGPGAITERHIHPPTQFIYVLDGVFTVAAEGPTTGTFPAGKGLVETTHPHVGSNRGSAPLRFLAVFAGEAGSPPTVNRP